MRYRTLHVVMARSALFCALALGLLKAAFSQLLPAGNGAAPAGLAGAYTAVQSDVWAMSANPAAIATAEHAAAGVYLRQSLLLKEMNYGGFAAMAPVAKGHVVGFEAASFGFSAYRQTAVGVGYGGYFGEKLSAGAKLNLCNLSIQDLGSASSISVDAGLQLKLSPTLVLGSSLLNANRAKLNTLGGKQDMPSSLNIGLGYRPNTSMLLSADLVKSTSYAKAGFRGGIAYQFSPAFTARVGVGTQPLLWSIGLGLQQGKFRADAAFSQTAQLGGTPHVGITYGL